MGRGRPVAAITALLCVSGCVVDAGEQATEMVRDRAEEARRQVEAAVRGAGQVSAGVEALRNSNDREIFSISKGPGDRSCCAPRSENESRAGVACSLATQTCSSASSTPSNPTETPRSPTPTAPNKCSPRVAKREAGPHRSRLNDGMNEPGAGKGLLRHRDARPVPAAASSDSRQTLAHVRGSMLSAGH